MKRGQDDLSSFHSEGALLPPDFLSLLLQRPPKTEGVSADDYRHPGERLEDVIARSWSALLGVWASFQTQLAKLPVGDHGTELTRKRWLGPLFQTLDFGLLTPLTEPIVAGERRFAISHRWEHALLHLVGWHVPIDVRTKGAPGATEASPHALVQLLLNMHEGHLWGLVTNGRTLRLLRDNQSLSRQAFVDIDVEGIFAGQRYADFRLLWLLCHASRFASQRPVEQEPTDCWLERWRIVAQNRGVAALDRLRGGVQKAIERLGNGFAHHPANSVLQAQLAQGTLTQDDYYRHLLRLVYRLILVLAAEERGVLLLPSAPAQARALYTEHYALGRIRDTASKIRGGPHVDLWHGLRLVLTRLHDGCEPLALPALGSFLFRADFIPWLSEAMLSNEDLLATFRELCFVQDGGKRQRVRWQDVGADELGSVYEALLEMKPRFDREERKFVLGVVAGNERKTSGSYYTPSSLVDCLLDSALDPVVDQACQGKTREEAIAALLDLKVCDPACGSGHFLVAAGRRIARRLASLRSGEEEPSPEALRHALREVVGRCLYGVDLNPMAVELCKVSLWMEAVEPGLPLTFLNSHIQHGNALLGTTPEMMKMGIPDVAWEPIEGDDRKTASALKKRNKQAAEGQRGLDTLWSTTDDEKGNAVTQAVIQLEATSDADAKSLANKELQWDNILDSIEYRHQKFVADSWCAAFAWPKQPGPLAEAAPTNELWRQIRDSQGQPPSFTVETVEILNRQYHFFHWPLAFPHVFAKGGFDVVLGNPPWERVKLQEAEWFAAHRPDIAMAPNASARKKLISALIKQEPFLHAAFRDAIRTSETESGFLRNSSRFPLCGRGDINSYAVFAETFYAIAGPKSSFGLIVPSGILADDTTKLFFKHIQDRRILAQAIDFENNETLFPGVGHGRMRFCLLTVRKGTVTEAARLFFLARSVIDLSDGERWFELRPGDAPTINPNSETCPVFLSKRDAEITRAVYGRFPVLRRESPANSPWGARLHRVFDMTIDAEKMKTAPSLQEEGWRREGRNFRRGSETMLPIVEGKMTTFYDHRAAHIRLNPDAPSRQQQTEDTTDVENQDPRFFPEAYLWAPAQLAQERFHEDVHLDWAIAFKRVTSATNWRTMVACVVPDTLAISYTLYIIDINKQYQMNQHCFISIINSLAYDYFVRQKTMQPSLPIGPIYETVMPTPTSFDASTSWSGQVALRDWIATRVAELVCVSDDLVSFASATLGRAYVFRWNPERRQKLQDELDAMAFHHFGLNRAEVEHVMSTFPKVREYEQKAHGDFRTKRVVLEIYDAMAEASANGASYVTCLDPPPADPRVAHPPKEEGAQ